jgi:hypothetical protein
MPGYWHLQENCPKGKGSQMIVGNYEMKISLLNKGMNRANPYLLSGFCTKCHNQIINCAIKTNNPDLVFYAKDADKRHQCKGV